MKDRRCRLWCRLIREITASAASNPGRSRGMSVSYRNGVGIRFLRGPPDKREVGSSTLPRPTEAESTVPLGVPVLSGISFFRRFWAVVQSADGHGALGQARRESRPGQTRIRQLTPDGRLNACQDIRPRTDLLLMSPAVYAL